MKSPSSTQMDKRFAFRTAVDVVSIVALQAARYVAESFEPFQRGFWCSDETIKLPVRSPGYFPEEKVNGTNLYLFIFFIISESVYHLVKRRKSWQGQHKSRYWINLITIIGSWLLVSSIAQLITRFIQMQVGRLSPDFIQVCKPSISCSDPSYRDQYIADFHCTAVGIDENSLRMSFPSWNSTQILVSMVFFVIYLTKRYNFDCVRYLVACLQSAAIILAIYLGNIYPAQANSHHWQDGIASFFIGSTVTLIGTLLPGRLDHLEDRVLISPSKSLMVAEFSRQFMKDSPSYRLQI